MKKKIKKDAVTPKQQSTPDKAFPGARDPKIAAFVRDFYAKHGKLMSRLANEGD